MVISLKLLSWKVHLVKNEKKKRVVITEMNHKDGVERESVNVFSFSATKTF